VSWGSAAVIAVVAIVVAMSTPDAARIGIVSTASALAVAGVVWRDRRWAWWLSLSAVGVVLIMGLASPDTRVDTLVMGTYTVVFLAALVTSRAWGLAWISLGVLAMSIVVTRSDVVVQVGTVDVNAGSVAVVQMVVAGTWLWWAWHGALDKAALRDARAEEQEHVIAESIAVQERTRAWRETITRTHETILNDLRYVLRTPRIEHDRLRDQLLTTRDRRAQPPRGGEAFMGALGLEDLDAKLRSEFAGALDFHMRSDEPSAERIAEVEPALLEIVRNIGRHSDARRIEIVVDDVGGQLRITVEDDGSTPAAAESTPGIGRSVVVGDALAALGAHLDEEPHRCVIVLPRSKASFTSAGRTLPLLFGVILVASALGGSVQFLLLLAGASLSYLPVTLAACALTAVAVITVLRGRAAGLVVLVAAAVLAAAVPWGLSAAEPICAQAPLVLTTLNLSLNAFFAILLWASSRWAWLLVTPALTGVLALDLLPGVGCPLQDSDVLLSSAILIPAALALSWLSSRSTARWEREDRARWETEIAEIARAEADVDLAHMLGDSVDHAWAQMWEIAEGADLNDERRQRLRAVESSIRASLQADPRVSGGFVLAARQVVSEAATRNAPIHVRALRGSSDARPLPSDFIARLTDVVTDDADAGASIHVFFDGHDDYLAVTVPGATAARAGFTPGEAEDHGCCSIEVSYVGDDPRDSEVTIVVSRPVESSATAPSVMG
jgi:signal transduction histidine kinase